ncbi:MAG: leucine-rich repeat domain-containing protein [Bacteroidales bacterium]
MKRNLSPFHLLVIFFLFCLFVPSGLQAQKNKQKKKNEKFVLPQKDIENYKDQALGLVKFYQGTLNFLGDTVNLPVEKETIINQSWDKIFESKKTQVEDDLIADRFVPVNKDVQAYLKDIDFFYKYAHFDFDIENIDFHTTPEGKMFFKVKLNRHLFALSAYNDTLENDRLRFIEINLDPYHRALKIASVYTTRINIREELQNWWNTMSPSWRDYFGNNLFVRDTTYSADSIRLSDIIYFSDTLSVIRKMVSNEPVSDSLLNDSLSVSSEPVLDSTKLAIKPVLIHLRKLIHQKQVDVSGNQQISDVEPLSELSDLEVLNCSNTQVPDLSPLRNLSFLNTIEASACYIQDISGLRYLSALQNLNISNTKVSSLDPVMNLSGLRRLDVSSCPVVDLQPLALADSLTVLRLADTEIKDLSSLEACKSLVNLDLSMTRVSDLSPISSLPNLSVLNIETSLVTDLKPLSDIKTLSFLQLSNTRVSDLDPLNSLPKLRRVYCENTRVTANEANSFMRKNQGTLVIFESNALRQWWDILPEEWKDIFAKKLNFEGDTPKKEDLHEIIRLPELDLSDMNEVKDLYPLSRLVNLRKLNLSSCPILSIEPLADLVNLESLNISETKIRDISPLLHIAGLQELWADDTQINNLDALKGLSELKLLVVDNTPLQINQIASFRQDKTNCVVVYDSQKIKQWWDALSDQWHNILSKPLDIKEQSPSRLDLANIIHIKVLDMGHQPDLQDLNPLRRLVSLEKLYFNGSRIMSLDPISHLNSLEVLVCPDNPITNLDPLSNFTRLVELNIENTQVEDLSSISKNIGMQKLLIAGTRVRNLRSISAMTNIEELIIFNTKVRSISALKKMNKLKLFKCYNTRISQRVITKFKQLHPKTDVVYY